MCMKTIAIIVTALAIAFAAFKVGAHFEQKWIEQCAAAVEKKYEDDAKEYRAKIVPLVDRTMKFDGKKGPKPERGMSTAQKIKAMAGCERNRIFALR